MNTKHNLREGMVRLFGALRYPLAPEDAVECFAVRLEEGGPVRAVHRTGFIYGTYRAVGIESFRQRSPS